MSTNARRFYVIVPMDDGTATLLMFLNKDYDVHKPVGMQLDKACFADRMPLNEMLELGSSLVTGGVAASRQYAEKVRYWEVQKDIQNQVLKPADPMELARIAAFMEGVNLDPTADVPMIKDSLNKKDKQEEAALKELENNTDAT